MCTLGHALGVVFLVLAAAALVAQGLSFYASRTYQPIALATIWAAVNTNSLVGFGAFIENRISPPGVRSSGSWACPPGWSWASSGLY